MRLALVLLFWLITCFAVFTLGTLRGTNTIAVNDAQWSLEDPTAQAWHRFTTSLEAAGESVAKFSQSNVERLSGYDYLTDLASVSLEMKVGRGDPGNPTFTEWMQGHRKFLGDSPDARYQTAEISPEHHYMIKGTARALDYFGIIVYQKNSITGWNQIASNLSTPALTRDESGAFSVLLSPEKPPGYSGNWLRLTETSHMLMTREYSHKPMTPNLLSINVAAHHSRATSDSPAQQSTLAARIDAASAFFNLTLKSSIALAETMESVANTFERPLSLSNDYVGIFYPTADNDYFGGAFNLGADDKLIIEGEVPNANYWSVALQNVWMQSIPGAALNNRSIAADDGKYRIVVSAKKPIDEPNWLGTQGYHRGLIAIRYQQAVDATPPTVRLESASPAIEAR